ncbi:Uu.00g097050.m01.CDS01 [Anthostomella pinea]|uniref:Uu.00g097050.m01.CDS01 n=1 Tax=Anthostomella pinea TaxID=933095 RepID=A0AAI8VCE9_9PEZI|nr:Uu.00g097050.m01.CDS01 [Anthostomella pinea]
MAPPRLMATDTPRTTAKQQQQHHHALRGTVLALAGGLQVPASAIKVKDMFPGDFSDDVKVTLQHVLLCLKVEATNTRDLMPAPAYEALSYVWGSEKNPGQVIVPGISGNTTISIT